MKRKAKIVKTCQSCRATFDVLYPSQACQRFCSIRCVGKYNSKRKHSSNKVSNVCGQCGAAFDVYPSQVGKQFCTMKCATDNRTTPELSKICEMCGVAFDVRPHKRKRRFCSVLCGAQYSGLRKRDRVTEKCKQCGDTFERTRTSKQRFCKLKCGKVSVPKISKTCERCGRTFEVWPSQPKRFCNMECRRKRVVLCDETFTTEELAEACGISIDVVYYRIRTHGDANIAALLAPFGTPAKKNKGTKCKIIESR